MKDHQLYVLYLHKQIRVKCCELLKVRNRQNEALAFLLR